MSDFAAPHSLASIPWTTTWEEFVQEATDAAQDGACCLFSVVESIPREARKGYAALVIAYTRDGEPVTLLDDGLALLLVRHGGIASAEAVARRVMQALERLELAPTVRIGFIATGDDVDGAVTRLREQVPSINAGTYAAVD